MIFDLLGVTSVEQAVAKLNSVKEFPSPPQKKPKADGLSKKSLLSRPAKSHSKIDVLLAPDFETMSQDVSTANDDALTARFLQVMNRIEERDGKLVYSLAGLLAPETFGTIKSELRHVEQEAVAKKYGLDFWKQFLKAMEEWKSSGFGEVLPAGLDFCLSASPRSSDLASKQTALAEIRKVMEAI